MSEGIKPGTYINALKTLGTDKNGKFKPIKLETSRNLVNYALSVDAIDMMEGVDSSTLEGRELFHEVTGLDPNSTPDFRIRSLRDLTLRGGRSDIKDSTILNLETLAGNFDSSNLAFQVCPSEPLEKSTTEYENGRNKIFEATGALDIINHDPKKYVEFMAKNQPGALGRYILRYAKEFIDDEIAGFEIYRGQALKDVGGAPKFLADTYKGTEEAPEIREQIVKEVKNGAHFSIKQQIAASIARATKKEEDKKKTTPKKKTPKKKK